ncbi:MAG: NAD-dependent epimerase/dehydratase family protein [Candidatus Latescibacteria bacterium]|nr:NAD-dependent epimerase/dehydratase family protein [Candidatus Latescibacterota bacterium]
MRVLIIGGTSFIGPAIVRRLHERGCEVALFHRGQTGAELPDGVQHILGDRKRIADFRRKFKRFAPEVVVNTISFSEEDARSFVETFRGLAKRTVVLSSGDVYRAFGVLRRTEAGPVDPVPLTEDAPLRQNLFPFGGDYDKIPVERAVMGAPDLPGTILRLPAVHGPEDYQHRLFRYLKRMEDRRPAILLEEGVARWRWTRGYVENVAEAVALGVMDARAAGRVYNVGEMEAFTEAEWVREIAQVAGWKGAVVAVPGDRLPASMKKDINTDQDIIVDTARIRKELDYREPVPPEEALRRTIAWEQENPPEIDPQDFDYAAEDRILAGLV